MRTFFLAAAASVSLGGIAEAAPVDPVAMLGAFSVIALGDYTLDSDTPAPVYVGGDFATRGNHSINVNGAHPNGTVGDATGALIVGGRVKQGAQSNVRGSVALAGDEGVVQPNPNQRRFLTANGAEFNLQDAGNTVVDEVDVPVDEVRHAFEVLSSSWAALDDSGLATLGGDANNPRLVIEAGPEGYAVLNLAASDLFGQNRNPQISFVGGPVTTIINVAGTTFDNASSNLNWFQGANNVIFNFYEATSIAINSTFGASIFAPFADISANAGGANAFMVGNNITQHYEVRTPFNGELPPPPSAIPLPAAGWLLVIGLAGLAAAGRRRSA